MSDKMRHIASIILLIYVTLTNQKDFDDSPVSHFSTIRSLMPSQNIFNFISALIVIIAIWRN